MDRGTISKAWQLAQKYFKDKTDKGGHPYMGHMERIAAVIEHEKKQKCADDKSTLALFYDKCIVVALLHDLLEDTDYTEQQLRDDGFDDEIVDAVVAITRRKDEQLYFEFIDRVSKNDIARLVKIYDLEDNMDIRRLSEFGDYEQKRLKKYWYCWKYLRGEINAVTCNNTIHPNNKIR